MDATLIMESTEVAYLKFRKSVKNILGQNISANFLWEEFRSLIYSTKSMIKYRNNIVLIPNSFHLIIVEKVRGSAQPAHYI